METILVRTLLSKRHMNAVTVTCMLLLFVAPSLYKSVQSYNDSPGFELEVAGIVKNTKNDPSALTDHDSNFKAVYDEYVIDNGGRATAHSATHTQLPDGDIRAFWYGGSREGARDVNIYTARFQSIETKWGPAYEIMDSAMLSNALGRRIKKLGNPVAFRDMHNRIWLYFVSVSFGGWSGSSINVMSSHDGGKTFSSAKRLVTSPMFNISTLVRGRPVQMQDGSIMLPVYHELLGKFSELLHLTPDQTVLRKKRLSLGRQHIQPVLVPLNADTAIGYLRNSGGASRIHYVMTRDAGLTFTPPKPTNLQNSDSAIDVVNLGDGGILMVYNNSASGRHILSLAVSHGNPEEWTHVWDLENSDHNSTRTFAYPSISRSADGWTNILYTYNRQYIKHVRFNDAWLWPILAGGVTKQ